MDTDRIKGAGRELYGRGEEAIGSLTGDKETRARGMVDQVAGKAQGAMGRVGETVRDAAEQVVETGRDYLGRGRQMGRHIGGDGQMRTPPVGALLIAATAGFALAWMLHARER
jgi:uncharacterized protein YjbJ (UPF0337 family)